MENRNGKLIVSTKGLRVGITIVCSVLSALFIIGSIWFISQAGKYSSKIYGRNSGTEMLLYISGIMFLGMAFLLLFSIFLGARPHVNVYENCVEGAAVNASKFTLPYSQISSVREEGKRLIVIRTKDGASYKVITAKNKDEALNAIRSRISEQ